MVSRVRRKACSMADHSARMAPSLPNDGLRVSLMSVFWTVSHHARMHSMLQNLL